MFIASLLLSNLPKLYNDREPITSIILKVKYLFITFRLKFDLNTFFF